MVTVLLVIVGIMMFEVTRRLASKSRAEAPVPVRVTTRGRRRRY